MSDKHSSFIKTPKQLVIVVALAIVRPDDLDLKLNSGQSLVEVRFNVCLKLQLLFLGRRQRRSDRASEDPSRSRSPRCGKTCAAYSGMPNVC